MYTQHAAQVVFTETYQIESVAVLAAVHIEISVARSMTFIWLNWEPSLLKYYELSTMALKIPAPCMKSAWNTFFLKMYYKECRCVVPDCRLVQWEASAAVRVLDGWIHLPSPMTTQFPSMSDFYSSLPNCFSLNHDQTLTI